jgi:hypothetical protein
MCRFCTSWVAAFEASGSFRSVCVQTVPGQLEVDVFLRIEGQLGKPTGGSLRCRVASRAFEIPVNAGPRIVPGPGYFCLDNLCRFRIVVKLELVARYGTGAGIVSRGWSYKAWNAEPGKPGWSPTHTRFQGVLDHCQRQRSGSTVAMWMGWWT